MKKILRLLCIIAAHAALLANARAVSLIALWEFDGNYLNSGADPLYDLTPGGGVTLAASPRGMAAEFHGGTYLVNNQANLDRLETLATPTSASFNGGFSLMAWVKLNSSDPNHSTILSHDSSAIGFPSNLGFGINVYSTLTMQTRNTSDQRNIGVADGSPISTNQWYHIAVTWDGALSDGYKFYVDGQQIAHDILTSGIQTGFQGLNSTTSLPFRIGAHQGNADNVVRAFDGQIDHLSIYSGALALSEIQADYNATATVPESSATLWLLTISLIGCTAVRWNRCSLRLRSFE